MKESPAMQRLLALWLIVVTATLGLACGKPRAEPIRAAAQPGNGAPPNGVYICDGISATCHVLGTSDNPMVTTGTGGSGSSSVTVLNDAGNPVPVSGTVAILSDAGQQMTAVTPTVGVLLTTGSTPNLGLAGASGCHVTSLKVQNYSASNAWAFLSNGTAIPDAGFTGLIDTVTLVPANGQIVLGTDHFGQAGLQLDAGCSVGISGTSTSDGGHGAGSFTAVSKDFDISVYGYSP